MFQSPASRLPPLLRLVLSTGFGVSSAVALLNEIHAGFWLNPWAHNLELAVLGLLLSLVCFVLSIWAQRQLTSLSSIQKRFLLAVCLLFAVLAPAVLPLRSANQAGELEVSILATGRKEPRATGTAVALYGGKRDGEYFDLASCIVTNDGNWAVDGDRLRATATPAKLTMKVKVRDTLSFDFASLEEAGVAEITWQGTRRAYSLFSPWKVMSVGLTKWEPLSFRHAFTRAGQFLIAVSLTLLLSILLFAALPVRRARTPRHRLFLLASFLYLCLIWGVLWAAFFPGLLSWDSLYQWGQAQTLHMDGIHPPFHTLMIWAVTRIWSSPAAVTACGVIGMAGATAWAFSELVRAGLRTPLAWGLVIPLSLLPFNGFITITLWKDVPFGISMVLLMGLLFKTAETRARFLEAPFARFSMAAALVLVALFRHNGIVPALASIVALIVLGKPRRAAVQIAAMWLAVFIAVRWPLYQALGVKKIPDPTPLAMPLQTTGALLQEGIPFSPPDTQLLARVIPVDLWGSLYSPFNFSTLTPYLNGLVLHSESPGFLKVWVHAFARHPKKSLRAAFRANSFLWRISPYAGAYTYTVSRSIEPNAFGLATKSLIPGLMGTLARFLEWSHGEWPLALLWRPALAMYLFVFLGCLAAIQQGPRLLAVMVPMVSNWAGLLAVSGLQDVRFLYPVFVAVFFVAGLLLMSGPAPSVAGGPREAGR